MLSTGKPSAKAIRETLDVSSMLNLLRSASDNNEYLNQALQELVLVQESNERQIEIMTDRRKQAEAAEKTAREAEEKATLAVSAARTIKESWERDNAKIRLELDVRSNELAQLAHDLGDERTKWENNRRIEEEKLRVRDGQLNARISQFDQNQARLAQARQSMQEVLQEFVGISRRVAALSDRIKDLSF